MNSKHVCRVLAPRETGEPELLGTGFLLSPKRVLTASHLLDGEPALWVRLEGGAPNPTVARTLWSVCHEEIDAALLELEQEIPLLGDPPRLVRYEIQPSGDWESFGYPKLAETKRNGATAVSGGFGGPRWQILPAERRLELEASRHAATPEGWKGASGAAVFAGGRLVGVIREAHPTQTNILFATPIWRLAAEPGFLDHLEAEDLRAKRKRELIEQVAAILTTNGAARGRLAAARTGGDLPASELAACLCEQTPLRDLFVTFDRVRRDIAPLDHLGRTVLTEGARSEILLLERLLALVAPVACFSRSFLAEPAGKGGLLRLEVATETLAELVLAGSEGRPARFLPPQSPGQAPRPEAQLNLPPPFLEAGMKPGAPVARLWAFLKFNEDLLQGAKKQTIPLHEPDSIEHLLNALQALNDRLAALADPDREHPMRSFVFFGDFSTQADRDFALELERHLGQLILVQACVKSSVEEERQQALLGDFYYVSGQARRSSS